MSTFCARLSDGYYRLVHRAGGSVAKLQSRVQVLNMIYPWLYGQLSRCYFAADQSVLRGNLELPIFDADLHSVPRPSADVNLYYGMTIANERVAIIL